MDFNKSKHSYREQIEESIRFSGKSHDFFVDVKADILRNIVKQYLPQTEKPLMLDIGCGHGFIHKQLHNKGFDIVGVEMASEVLELAQDLNPEVKYIGYDGKTLPFPSQSFDIAIAICVMHHVPPTAWNNFLLEMKRILRKDGIAVIIEHNPFNPLTQYVVASSELDRDAVLLSHFNLKKLMKEAGFISPKSHFTLFTPFALKIFRCLDQLLKWCPLGAQYYTVAKI